jgi:glycerol kinase
MTKPVVAIDVGTTTVRALVVDAALNVQGRAFVRPPLAHPAQGRVEQDVELVRTAVLRVIDQALASAELRRDDVGAIGISAQRSNVIVWDRTTGAPLAPLVSWQDMRGAARTAELVARGFLVSHQTAAVKLEAVLDGMPSGRDRLNAGSILWGNVDTYLAWRLSDGSIYTMDHGHACATGYYDYFNGAWNTTLIEAQRLDPARFPLLTDTAKVHGTTGRAFGAHTPIAALVADQQSALIAQGGLASGLGKITYGTSATLDVNSGAEMKFGPGTYPMVIWTRDGAREFCIEGMVNTAGAMLDWACTELRLAADAAELCALAGTVHDSAGACVLPALQGLGTPYGDPARHATIGGLTRATTRAHVARAVLDGIAFRVREAHDAIRSVELPLAATIRVDGGASRSDTLMQLQADVLGLPVERLAIPEASALGAAICALLAIGAADADAIERPIDRTFEPRLTDDEREARFARWRRECGLAGA